MSRDTLDLAKLDDETAHQANGVEAQRGFTSELLHSAAYAAFAAPAIGVSQLGDHIFQTKSASGVANWFDDKFGVTAPEQLSFASSGWFGSTLGTAAGMLLPVAGLKGAGSLGSKGVRTVLGKFGSAEAADSVGMSARAGVGSMLKQDLRNSALTALLLMRCCSQAKRAVISGATERPPALVERLLSVHWPHPVTGFAL